LSPALFDFTATVVKLAVFAFLLINVVPIMVWVERRGSAFMQDRPGPNRLGPLGLVQPIADVVKFLFKEDVTPSTVDRTLYLLAPMLALVPGLTTFVVVPFGPTVTLAGRKVELVVTSAGTGVLLFLALASLGVYSLVLAGYSSNNKYSLLGSIRASAQLVSYELALTLSVLAVVLPVQSFRLNDIIGYQLEHMPLGMNILPQFLGFTVFLVAAFAETNRLPFDLPEAESELVAGYHTEYSAMRFAAFFMAEYISMTVLSALLVTLYFGGWSLPWWDGWPDAPILTAVCGLAVLFAKVGIVLFFFVWVRWTYPRFRYDQLMRLGWKVLLPLSLANLVLIAALTLAGVL
jgi:NADH-quinone oxidoreductase subunit H